MTETIEQRIDNIVDDLTASAAADALLGACVSCSHRGCERKRQAERDTQIAGQELAEYIATLRAQLAGVREKVEKLPTVAYIPTAVGIAASAIVRDDVLAALDGDA